MQKPKPPRTRRLDETRSNPGRNTINTPIRPTAVASQRRKPTLSLRRKIDSAVTNNGETKLVAGCLRNRDEPQAGDEEHRRRQQRRAAHHQETGAPRRQRDRTASPAARAGTMISRNTQKPDPGDLDRGQRRRQIFGGDVGSPEKHRGEQHQRDTAKWLIGMLRHSPSRRLLFGQRRWRKLQPGRCG